MKQVSPDLLAAALRQYPDPPEFAMPTETVGKYDYGAWANAIYAALPSASPEAEGSPDQPDALPTLEQLQAAWSQAFGGDRVDSDGDLAEVWRHATSAAAGEGGG